MRIGCLQFAPQVGDVDNNLNRADSVLSRANPDDLDLLVLPELAFSGYNFKSLQDIAPFLEPSGSGITSLWARTIALKYNCTVTVGYPEKVDVTPKWPTGPEYYNSVIVVNGDGETIANYRKSFLYHTDETWALEGGQGFYEGFIPGLGNTSIGICMDLNPYKFEAPWHAFEFAYHILEVESNLVIVSMAWNTREDPRRFTRMPNEPDMETLTYWVTRLEPLIRAENEDEIIVVFCNRTGYEDEALYAGTSAVIGIQDGEVRVYGLLGRGEKELLVVDTNNSPYAKLVYRPDPRGAGMEAPGRLQLNDETNNPRSNEVRRSSEDSKKDGQTESSLNSVTSPHSSGSTALGHHISSMSQRCTLPKDGSHDSTRRRQAPTITIPPAPGLVMSNSARSPGTDSLNIPTPSAPSPTPMSVRPRLIIPESPPILPHQYPPDHPISAASLRSERSVRSNMSQASNATVQTRPPEDSTPYPNSAAPLSGYPTNTFKLKDHPYNHRFTLASPDDGRTPLSLDGMSPSDAQRFWMPPDSAGPTPLSAGWTPATAVGRKPEPFPWSEITGEIRPLSTGTLQNRSQSNATPKDPRAFSPLSNTSSNRTNETVISESSEASRASRSSRASRETAKSPIKHDTSFARPPSPKSRNASRTGTRERSDSALEARDISNAITQHLEEISQRAESASRLRSESANGLRAHDWPQLRDRSNTRPRSAIIPPTEDHMIPIAASPSLFRNNNYSADRPPSRGGYQTRGKPLNNLEDVLQCISGERARTAADYDDSVNTTQRAASRGRMPQPKPLATNGAYDSAMPTAERSSSRDSTRNELLHSRTSQHRSRGRQSRTRRTSSGQHGRMPSHDNNLPREFERVESVVCPNCPVHGRNPSASGNRHTESAPPMNYPASRPVTVRPITSSPPVRTDSAPASVSTASAIAERSNNSTNGPTLQLDYTPLITPGPGEKPQDKNHEYVTNEVGEASDSGSFAETLQTISTPGRSPATPSFFNPSTPKAMVFKSEDLEVDPSLINNLNNFDIASGSLPEADTVQVA
ncbi:amino-terminal amidase [Fusarium globosum]|uniref:Amino-terminal amidase n=1 Tax=Fusarium globosum TaxID=78864 RepID=A0A8H5Y625_9HYPO|nr:amino-terminal amidase [Fusarium globosum]